MTQRIQFLDIQAVLKIHRRMIKEFGGDNSVRDHRLLESALAAPQSQFDGKFLHSTLASMAAAYLYHLCKNHPFSDGNKRTALAVAEVFLLSNGQKLVANNQDLYKNTIGVADSTISKDELVTFFEENVKPG